MRKINMIDFCKNVMSAFAMLAVGLLISTSDAEAQFRAFSGSGGGSAASSGPNLKATVDKIAAGTVTVGSTSFVVVLFSNDGVSPVTVGDVNLYPSSTVSAAVSLNQCSKAPLPPGANCAITVAVSGLQAGSYRIEMLVDHDGLTRLATSSIEGTIEASGQQQLSVQSELEAFPEVLAFGVLKTGAEQVRSVTFRNRTSEEITLRDIVLEGSSKSGFSFESSCSELKPGEACLVTVRWAPTRVGEAFASLSILHDGVSGISRLDITGEYAPESPADATIYPDALPNTGLLISDRSQFDFASGIESVSSITASLVNIGESPVILKSIRLSGSENGLSVSRNGCKSGLILESSSACALTISWAPSRAGPVIDDVQVQHTGARGILVIPVRGDADSAVSRDSMAVMMSNNANVDNVEFTPVLDGYIVTSLSPRNAVISGPVGTLIVRNKKDVLIGGVNWAVKILPSGVELSHGSDVILLVFDRTLTPNRFRSNSSSSSDDDDDNNNN